MTDNLKPIRDIIEKRKKAIETEISELENELKEFGFKDVSLDLQKEYVKCKGSNRLEDKFKATFIITIKPVL